MKSSIALLFFATLASLALAQCPPTALPYIDNFDSPTLDSCWTWIREDTSHWSLTERPGWMRIVSNGDLHGATNDARNLLLRQVPDTNFILLCEVSIVPTPCSGAGLIVYHDDANQLNVMRIEEGVRFHSETNDNVVFSTIAFSDSNCFLRIDKVETHYSAFASSDGLQWTFVGEADRSMSSSGNIRVGIWAGNCPTYSTVTADFDYFRVDPLPGTSVCGNVSGVWDSTGSPYYVTCDVTVPAGQTLEIHPGVQVLFTGQFEINVMGTLNAVGTATDSIVFRAELTSNPNGWRGIRLPHSGAFLSYCEIRDAHRSGDYGGALFMNNGYVEANHCLFSQNSNTYGGAVAAYNNSWPVFTECVFSNNSAGATGQGGAIHSIGYSAPTFERCVFLNNTAGYGGALACYGAWAHLRSCVMWQNSAYEGGAIWIYSNSGSLGPDLLKCTMSGNAAVYGGGIKVNSGSASISNSIVWGNAGQQISAGTVSYSDIQGGYAGIGNIDADPTFVDAANADFHLQAGSPCIDAGDPDSPLDPDSTRADMGAFPYYHPCLKTVPDSLEFGLLDVGSDSTMQVVLRNPTSQPIPVTSISCGLPEFSFDTVGLGGQVAPFAAYYLSVTFTPGATGSYVDTLAIVVQHECDTLIRIPLYGEADVILPAVDSLVIQKGPMNGMQLDWEAVTHSIGGQPLQGVSYTIYGSTSVRGPFVPFGYADTNSYVHPNILSGQAIYFYQVTAEVGEGRRAR